MINKILIGRYHAKYPRQMVNNIHKFKEHVYQAEDAWKHVIILTNKNKKKQLWQRKQQLENLQKTDL